jgi:hypothetical protein
MSRKKVDVYMGSIAVDSGQLLISDPSYIDSEWEQENFEDIRIYKNKKTGKKLQYVKDFPNYGTVIPKYKKTMNQLIATGEWIKMNPPKAKKGFSYNACTRKTLSKEGFGELNFKMGHSGAGLAFSTTIGDGLFPVYGKFNDDGILDSVIIKFTARHFKIPPPPKKRKSKSSK